MDDGRLLAVACPAAGRGCQRAVVGLRRGDGSGNRGRDRAGGRMIGGLDAIGLLAQRCDLLCAGTAPRRRADRSAGLWRVGTAVAAGRVGAGAELRAASAGEGLPDWSSGRCRLKAMNVDDEAPWIGKQKSRVVGYGAYVEHNPGYVVGELRRTDALEKAVIDHFDRFAVQRRSRRAPCRSK